jgi:hypothetical protein
VDAPNCRNWQAQLTQNDFGAQQWTLTVVGEVETSPSDPAYTLYVRDAEGERIRLQLGTISLVGAASGTSGSDAGTCWCKVAFQQTDLPGPVYNNLMVLYQDFVVGTGPVEVVPSATASDAPGQAVDVDEDAAPPAD